MTVNQIVRATAIGYFAIGLAGCATDPPVIVTAAPESDGVLAGEPVGPPCPDDEVSITVASTPAELTHRGVRLLFALADDGDTPCVLSGYPGVESGAGGPGVHADRTRRGYLGGQPAGQDDPPVALLTTQRPAHALVEGVAIDEDGNPCPTYTELAVTAPGGTRTVAVPVTVESCRLEVHPVTDDDSDLEPP